MKLSDVVSGMHLTIYAELPLLMFLGVFIGVAVYLLGNPKNFAQMSALPLRDEHRPRQGRSR
jgi:cbb3-type cytochrome oxidase subunit 3